MDYIKVAIDTKEEAFEIISEMLLSVGAKGTQAEGGGIPDVSGYDYVDEDEIISEDFAAIAYFAQDGEVNAKLREIQGKLDEFKKADFGVELGSLEMTTSTVYEEDWSTAWKKYFKPQKISGRVVIKPTWEEYSPKKDEVILEIDPGMAFGTGTHETTRMCINLIEEFMKEGAQVLDVGCGSGILSVAAAKLGAQSVLGLDMDSVAVEVAKENIAVNGVEDKVEIITSDIMTGVEKGRKFDFVAANIIADIIIRLNEDISDYMKDDAVYICSGIILERKQDVLNSLAEKNFKVLKVVEMGEWCAVACSKK